MESKYTALFSQVKIDGKTYYKCEFIVPIFKPTDRFDKLEDRENSDKKFFYITATQSQFSRKGIKEGCIYLDHNGMQLLSDSEELKRVKEKFDLLRDIIMPREEEKQEELHGDAYIDYYVNKVYDDAKCQKEGIRQIIETITFNKETAQFPLTQRNQKYLHDNIFLYGPLGTGKEIVLRSIKRNMDIPVIEFDLDEEVEVNIELLLEGLENCEREFNGDAIVIVNCSYGKFQEEFDGDGFLPLKQLAEYPNVCFGDNLKKPVDLSRLTFICSGNIPSYSINPDPFKELGYHSFFLQSTGFSKIVPFKRLSVSELRRAITESAYGALKLCEELAKIYKKEFVVNKTMIQELIRLSYESLESSLANVEFVIIESFKSQLKAGKQKIVIGSEVVENLKLTLNAADEVLKHFLTRRGESSSSEEDDDDVIIGEDPDRIDMPHTNDVDDGHQALEEKEKMIDDLVEQVKLVIKGQDSKVRTIVSTIVDNQEIANNKDEKYPEHKKENILIRGESGTGKTEIVRTVASLLKVPIIVETSTKFTEEGYVGNSVTDILLHLLNEAGGNVELAEKGIVVIDEIDKKADMKGGPNSDVSRGAVLDALLTMIEGTKIQLEVKRGPFDSKTVTFDTSRLTFIFLGAFEGLDEIREKRVGSATKPKKAGFLSEEEQQKEDEKLALVSKDFTKEDYTAFGMREQFINRLGCKVYLNKLDRAILIDIMKNGILSPLRLFQEKYGKYNIEIEFTDDFYERLADLAIKKKSNARGIDESFNDLKQFLRLEDIKMSAYSKLTFTGNCFDDPNALLCVPVGRAYQKH